MIIMLTIIYFLMTSTFNIPSTSTSSWLFLTLHIYIYIYIRDRSRWGPKGARAPPESFFFFFVILYFIFVVRPPLLPNQSSQLNPNSNYPTQKLFFLKKNKNIYNGDCILAKKLFYHQKTKNHVLLEKLKLNFLHLQYTGINTS